MNVSKVEVIYGKNASGKSAIIEALANLQSLFLPTTFTLPYTPFKFSDSTIEAPTTFEILFTSNNSEKSPIYKYRISYNKHAILFEQLHKYDTTRPTEVYIF